MATLTTMGTNDSESRTRNYTVTFFLESRKGLGSVSLKINNQHTHHAEGVLSGARLGVLKNKHSTHTHLTPLPRVH